MGEIYAIAREALAGGQAAFQFQSYPVPDDRREHGPAPDRPEHRLLARAQGGLRPVRGHRRGAPVVGVAAGRYAFAPSKDPGKRGRPWPPAGPGGGADRGPRRGGECRPCAPPIPTAAQHAVLGGARGPGRPRSATSAGRRPWPMPGRRWWSSPARPRAAGGRSGLVALGRPGLRPLAHRMAGFVPGLRAPARPFGGLTTRFLTRYGDGLPRGWRRISPAEPRAGRTLTAGLRSSGPQSSGARVFWPRPRPLGMQWPPAEARPCAGSHITAVRGTPIHDTAGDKRLLSRRRPADSGTLRRNGDGVSIIADRDCTDPQIRDRHVATVPDRLVRRPITASPCRFWGVRGSTPVSGPEYAEFGGSTPCLEVRCGERLFLVDAGSGLYNLRPAPPRPTCRRRSTSSSATCTSTTPPACRSSSRRSSTPTG